VSIQEAAARTDIGRRAPSTPAIEADVEVRIVRLEHLVAGLRLVLDRFQGSSAALGTTVFDNFDDPGAANEALDVLFASSMDARRDLLVLRLDVPTLVTAPIGSEHPLVTRLALLGASAAELAGGFEQYRRSIGLTVLPRSPGGIGRLDQFVAMVVRNLLEITRVMDGLRPDDGPLALAAAAVTHSYEPPIAARARRASVAALGMPVAGALWQVVRRRRTRLLVEFAGVAVVGVVVLVSALDQSARTPGSLGGSGSANAGPGRTGDTGVAVGGSPSGSPFPGASTEPGASAEPPGPGPSSAVQPPTTPRSTPRPTSRPTPTLDPAAAAAIQFNRRIMTAAGSIDGLLSTITTALQDADLAMAKAAADDIASIATAERAWLLSHPPAACYASFHDAALARYGELITTATAIAVDADAGDANAIHKEVASAHGDVSALKLAGSKAITACA
jgi:hypothetical protein